MSYKLVHKNILSIKADAIVNAANTKPVCTPGAEMELYNAAGPEDMLKARINIGEIPCGEACATEAFNLKARHVIHTAIPGPDLKEKELASTIKACYKNSLELAEELGCYKVAMSILLLDNYRFPKSKEKAEIIIAKNTVEENKIGTITAKFKDGFFRDCYEM